MQNYVADESVDFRLIKFLRESGYLLYVIREEKPGISDDTVLTFAVSLQAILLTEDKDFGELTIRFRKPNCGIILLRLSGIPIGQKNNTVLNALIHYGDMFRTHFTVINPDKIRIR